MTLIIYIIGLLCLIFGLQQLVNGGFIVGCILWGSGIIFFILGVIMEMVYLKNQTNREKNISKTILDSVKKKGE